MKTILLPEILLEEFGISKTTMRWPKVNVIEAFVRRSKSGRIIYSCYTFVFHDCTYSVMYSYNSRGVKTSEQLIKNVFIASDDFFKHARKNPLDS